MSRSNQRSKLQIIVWIVLAMVAEAVIVLLPVACAFSGKGFIAMWGAMSEKQVFVAIRGLVSGLGVFIGCPLGVLLIHGLRDIPEGFTTTFIGFINPWQLENYSLKKAIASFVLVYMLVVVVFALWFNACYLEGTKENPNSYFRTGDIENPNLWDFIYFSFVTITTLGYGDISPLHTFPQALVIVETMMGLGLVVGYLGIIVHVGGQKAQQKSDES